MDAGVGERLPLVVVGVVIWVRLSLFTGKEDAMGGSVIVGICLGVYDGKLALSCGEQEELLDCCRRSVGEDNLVGVNVLEGNFGNLLV